MSKVVVWSTAMCAIAVLLQSTLLSRIPFLQAIPDIALIILVYTAYLNGSIVGQTTGFTSGLIQDIISASPLGFNSFIRVIIGFLAGLLNGNFFLDTAIMPIILVFSATFLKAGISWLLHILFSGAVPSYSFSDSVFWIELIYNTFSSPFIFAFLNLFKKLLKLERQS